MKLCKFVILLMIFPIFMVCIFEVVVAANEYSIFIGDATWSRSTLSILLVPPEDSESWWNQRFVDLTLSAIEMWNDALSDFASEYPDFSYVSNIKLEDVVSAGATEDFDICIHWSENPVIGNEVGVTKLEIFNGCYKKNGNVTLMVKDGSGLGLTDVHMQNIAVHEIGHILGLRHCDYSNDVMFQEVRFDILVKPISTLDVYGVATVFRWRKVSPQYDFRNQDSRLELVNLPLGIEYEEVGIRSDSNPIADFLSLLIRHLQTPEGLIVFISVIVIIILLISFWRARKD